MNSADMAENTDMDDMESIRQSVVYQLRSNHYPPHPYAMVELAMDALMWFKEELKTMADEEEFENLFDWDKLFEVPTEIDSAGNKVPIGRYRGREDGMIPFGGIIEIFHLSSWIDELYMKSFNDNVEYMRFMDEEE
tara:strand:- start:160 stop:567 length:408 start_codon:yes stop_codon:yes gene_type:complete